MIFGRYQLKEATRQLSQDLTDYGFVLKVVSDNTTVPVILTDDHGNVITSRNLDIEKEKDKTYLKLEMQAMRAVQEPIEINIYHGQKNFLYFKDSKLFSELKSNLDDLIKSFISEVAVNSASVPVIYTDSTKQNVIQSGNVDSLKIKDPAFVKATLEVMASQNQPIEVEFGKGGKNYIFYQESKLLTQLKYYPYIMFSIIGLSTVPVIDKNIFVLPKPSSATSPNSSFSFFAFFAFLESSSFSDNFIL